MSNITSCCMSSNNNAWVVMNKKLYGIQDITNPLTAWNMLPTPEKLDIIHVTCGTRHNDSVGIVTSDNSIWISTKNIITIPEWKNTGTKGKSFNLWSNGTEFTFIGLDNEQYRYRGSSVKLPRPKSKAYPIAINDYNISYNNWGTFLGNDGKIYYDNNMFGGDINVANWWTRDIVDVPDATSYAQQDNAVLWVVQDGTLNFTENFRAKDGGFVKVKDVEKVKAVSAGNNRNFIAITTDNKVVWGYYDEVRAEQMNNLIDIELEITKYITKNAYASLLNELSNPNVSKDNLSYGPKSYIQNMAENNIINFAPYKILSLFDLMMIGRAHKAVIMAPTAPNMESDDPNRFDLWVMTFDNTDPYLPLSDVITPTINDINNVMCILIKNDKKYSSPIDPNDYKSLYNSWKRQEAYWTYTWDGGKPVNCGHRSMFNIQSAAKNINNRLYNNTDNIVLGDVFSGGNQDNGNDGISKGNVYYRSMFLYGNFISLRGTSVKGVNTDALGMTSINRVFATVNPQYLTQLKDFDPLQNEIVDTYTSYGNHYDKWKIYPSSPFNTFMIGGDSDILPNGYKYYDFLPEYLVAANCGNGKALSDLNITNKINPEAPIICQSWMNIYMSKNKYQNIKSIPVNDWCSQSVSECDNNLLAFCTMGENDKVYPNNSSGIPSAKAAVTTSGVDLLKLYPNSINKICSCFMPDDYTIANDYSKMLKGSDAETAKNFITQSIAAGAYNIPECYDTTCSTNKVQQKQWRTAPGGCKAVQICMNQAVIKNAGKITGNINIVQANNCVATTTNAAPTAGKINTSGPGSGSETGSSSSSGSGSGSGPGSSSGSSSSSYQDSGSGSSSSSGSGSSSYQDSDSGSDQDSGSEPGLGSDKPNPTPDDAKQATIDAKNDQDSVNVQGSSSSSMYIYILIAIVVLILLGGGVFMMSKMK